jgi:hypothetical protein
MPLYNCEICNLQTKIKTHFTRHLNTNKHITNVKNNDNNNEKYTFSPQNTSKSLTTIPQNTSKSLICPQNTSKSLIEEKKYMCEFCNKAYSRIDNLNRHIKTYCEKAKESVSYKELFIETKKQLIEEKEEFKKQIEILLTKVGNTTNHINNTQNIQLNSYGKEDMSHITDSLKNQLLKIPYGMIPKMIEAVHFNENKPENKNIAFTNKKDNKIKIYRNNKWIYRDKDETINDLIDGKYYLLDSHFDDSNDSMTITNKSSYEQFRTFFDDKDKELHDQLKKECELVLLNNR